MTVSLWMKSADNPVENPAKRNFHLRIFVQIYDAAGCFDPGTRGLRGRTVKFPRDRRGASVQKLLLLGVLLLSLIIGALVMVGDPALAHHAFAMFEFGSSIEIEGTVQELKFVNPHAFIILKVKGKDGRVENWTLEGQPTAMLEREGWTNRTLKPGDQIRLTIAPLRSGANGGAWTPQQLHFPAGKAAAAGRCGG